MFEISPIIAAFFSQELLLALLISLALIPIFKLPAEKFGLVDKPGGRKQHARTAALIGGPAIFFSFIATLLIFNIGDEYNGMLTATILLFLIGIIDDKYDISASIRLVLQTIIITGALWVDNVWIGPFELTNTYSLDFGLVAYPLTVVVILALKNAINMLDGIDGLSSGVSLIALGFIIAISQYTNQIPVLMVSTTLFGAILGFWAFNYRFKWRTEGASVFMGDSGSMLIGFLIPYIAIKVSLVSDPMTSPSLLVWFVAIPVWDIITVVIRRVKTNKSPIKPGRDHIHHILMNAGLEIRQILHLVYLLSIAAGTAGMTMKYLGVNPIESYVFFVIALALYMQRINSLERKFKSHQAELAVLGRTLEKVVNINNKR